MSEETAHGDTDPTPPGGSAVASGRFTGSPPPGRAPTTATPEGSITLLRRLTPAVYLPWLGFTLSGGVLVATLPLMLERAGLSTTVIGLLTAIAGVGAMAAGLPVAMLTRRLGEDRVLFVAVACGMLSSALLAPVSAIGSLSMLAVTVGGLRFLSGVGATAMRLSRQAMLTKTQDAARRGRSMALMGGTARVGLVIGPALGGWVADVAGFGSAFVVAGVVSLAGLALFPRRPARHRLDRPTEDAPRPTVRASLGRAGGPLFRGGVAAACITGARAGRLVLLPLLLDEFGLTLSEIGLVTSVGLGAELLLFPAAGATMDRFGRLWAMVPAYGLMALGLFGLALAGDATTAIVASIVMGIGNGLASGTMLTLSSDLAPAEDPGPFLAAIATISDIGKFAGPLLVGIVADTADLGTAAAVLGGLLVVAVVWLLLVVGETGAPTNARRQATGVTNR